MFKQKTLCFYLWPRSSRCSKSWWARITFESREPWCSWGTRLARSAWLAGVSFHSRNSYYKKIVSVQLQDFKASEFFFNCSRFRVVREWRADLVIPSPPCYPSVLGLLETLEFLEYQHHLWCLNTNPLKLNPLNVSSKNPLNSTYAHTSWLKMLFLMAQLCALVLLYLEVPVDLAFHLAQGNQDLQGYREYPLLLVVRQNLQTK